VLHEPNTRLKTAVRGYVIVVVIVVVVAINGMNSVGVGVSA
jgi:hypothetical protein